MPIVLGEQYYGEHRTAKPFLVTAVYGPYVVMPILVLARVWSPDVFPRPIASAANKEVARKTPSSPARRRAAASPARHAR